MRWPLLVLSSIILALPLYAADPVLYFTDLTSGPDTGIGDGLGSGTIVTVWGVNLGSSQGSNKIYYKDSTGTSREAAYVYYWENADPASGSSGPSDLYKYHKMQEIAFSIPDSANGAGKIYVTVSGVMSNELNFTVRAGRIFHAKATGSNSIGDGSWANPYRTMGRVEGEYNPNYSAGDIIYGSNGVVERWNQYYGLWVYQLAGTESNPIAFVAYPGATVTCSGSSAGIANTDYSTSTYITLSKLIAKGDQTGINGSRGGRIIGCKITDINGATGVSGAIDANNNAGSNRIGGLKVYGNYIHDWGYSGSSKYEHTTYFSNRGGSIVAAPEVAWNLLENNIARQGLHFYDEGACGDFSGTLKIHDNLIINQTCDAIDIISESATYPCFSMPVEIYNNVIIEAGYGINNEAVFVIGKYGNNSDIKIYNNTIFGYNDSSEGIFAFPAGVSGAFSGTWEFKNNIVVDTHNYPYYQVSGFINPSASSNNLWYNGGDSTPESAPAWDTSPLTTDPLFTNAASNDFTLSSTLSPCYDAGADLSGTFTTDFMGGTRSTWDIGAFEYTTGSSPSTPTIRSGSIRNGGLRP